MLSLIPIVDFKDVKIPPQLFISYAMSEERKASIKNNRINGFFDANVENIGRDHEIEDERYNLFGDLEIEDDENSAPYQF